MSRPELAERKGPLPRVLVVEDEEDIRNLVRYNLEQEGFGVDEAADGAEGYESIRRRMPDAMVLDLMLPGMSGLELCQRLRTETPTQRPADCDAHRQELGGRSDSRAGNGRG